MTSSVRTGDGRGSNSRSECSARCHSFTGCNNCTSNNCMWCVNTRQCVEHNAYVSTFPFGQCTAWTTKSAQCHREFNEIRAIMYSAVFLLQCFHIVLLVLAATRCEHLTSCDECHEDPACGWCDDGKNRGRGRCMQGGLSPPTSTDATRRCSERNWHFATCPREFPPSPKHRHIVAIFHGSLHCFSVSV